MIKSGGIRRASHIGAVAAAAALTACTVGPDYKRPSAPVPAVYKEAQPQPGWKISQPSEVINRSAWWSIYNDPVLDSLERRIDISNQNLKAAAAALREAEELVAEARSGLFPTADVSLAGQRSRPGAGLPITSLFTDEVTASWTPDFWGQIRREVEANVANAQASAADLASARLSAQGTLAGDYLQLRIADELYRLLTRLAKDYAELVRITRNQYAAGTAAQSDVSQAEALWYSTQARRSPPALPARPSSMRLPC